MHADFEGIERFGIQMRKEKEQSSFSVDAFFTMYTFIISFLPDFLILLFLALAFPIKKLFTTLATN